MTSDAPLNNARRSTSATSSSPSNRLRSHRMGDFRSKPSLTTSSASSSDDEIIFDRPRVSRRDLPVRAHQAESINTELDPVLHANQDSSLYTFDPTLNPDVLREVPSATAHGQTTAFTASQSLSPESFSSLSISTRNTNAGQYPIDQQPFESFHGSPTDPYAVPMYGIGQPTLVNASIPQSSTFAAQAQNPNNQALYMYSYNPIFAVGQRPAGQVQFVQTPPPGSPVALVQQPYFPTVQPTTNFNQADPAQGAMYGRTPQNVMRPRWTEGVASPSLSSSQSSSWGSGSYFQVGNPNMSMHRRETSTPLDHTQTFYMSATSASPAQQRSTFGRHARTSSGMSFGSSGTHFLRLGSSTTAQPVRSPLLEEFRLRHARGRRFELQDIRGAVIEFSTDQHGSRFAQEKLETAGDEDVQMIFHEILPQSRRLMTDVFGNYVVQKLMEKGTADVKQGLSQELIGHCLELSLNTYGCRVVQKVLDLTDGATRVRLANELCNHVMQCVRDQNANHVVQKVLEVVRPVSQVNFIPEAFRGGVFSLAAHCFSCRVLQRIFQYCDKEQSRSLMDELMVNAETLLHDQYGNYVIQWILRNGEKTDKDQIIALAKGNVLRFSRHKFASNVMEQILEASTITERNTFAQEILRLPPPELTLPFTMVERQAQEAGSPVLITIAAVMMRDQYGNYVLQKFLELIQGEDRERLNAALMPVLQAIKRSSNLYTKHMSTIENLILGHDVGK